MFMSSRHVYICVCVYIYGSIIEKFPKRTNHTQEVLHPGVFLFLCRKSISWVLTKEAFLLQISNLFIGYFKLDSLYVCMCVCVYIYMYISTIFISINNYV